jgi:hypothetical protein
MRHVNMSLLILSLIGIFYLCIRGSPWKKIYDLKGMETIKTSRFELHNISCVEVCITGTTF